MNKNPLLRIIVPLIVIVIGLGIVAAMVLGPGSGPGPRPATAPATTPGTADGGTSADAADQETTPEAAEPDAAPPSTAQSTPNAPPAAAIDGLHLESVPPSSVAAGSLGSLDPTQAKMLLTFDPRGAGIDEITFSDIWETAETKRAADAYHAALTAGEPAPTPPDPAMRYVLQHRDTVTAGGGAVTVPILSASQIRINGDALPTGVQWRETAPGAFELDVLDSADTVIATMRRTFEIRDPMGFEIDLRQEFINRTDQAMQVQWVQYGPSDLRTDRGAYIDRRRFRVGRLDATGRYLLRDDGRSLIERSDAVGQIEEAVQTTLAGDRAGAREARRLWPTRDHLDHGESLMWFGSVNRYFSLVVHAPLNADQPGPAPLTSAVGEVLFTSTNEQAQKVSNTTLMTGVYSPTRTAAAGTTVRFDLGVYTGPLDRKILGEPPYEPLGMSGLILYQMSSCCAICTFQWLAHLLLWFLALLHDYVLFDWGVAIIVLVLVVRTILHPLTKKTQVSMQKFGKAMSAMKPELDKLKEKHPNDPKRMQQEQMKLMREHGVNPMQALGCLPMFLQTPIWIALYAMLYFVWDLRHTPAFYGIFQKLTGGSWSFLGDLSAADHCFWVFDEPVKLFAFWNMTGINVLPILMGVVFFIQQKYLSPPPSPTMTKEQINQQRMMKIMMVVMMPLFLYNAPAGLTLYMVTSSTLGIIESRYIRAHVTEKDLKPKKPKRRSKIRDAQARAYAQMLEARKEKARRKAQGPEKRYKKRR